MFAALAMSFAMSNSTCPAQFEARQLAFRRPSYVPRFTPEATDTPLSAKATMRCLIGGGGALSNCTIEAVNPAGLGFGAWAIRYVQRWRVTSREVSGCPVYGRYVRVLISTKTKDN
jgi:hypothetical protein